MINWLQNYRSYIEVIATILGLLYIILSIKQNILLWPFGIVSSSLLIFVNYNAAFIANMVLQGFYVVMGLYGWIYWKMSSKKTEVSEPLQVKRMTILTIFISCITAIILGILIYQTMLYCIANKIIDCQNPVWDSVTTTLGIVATWMLIQKYIENWLLWIITDIISAGLYLNSKLYPTTILFISFTILAVVGYLKWKKDIRTVTI